MQISKIEALNILNITEATNAQAAYEQKLFEWKQKYLTTIPPVTLIKAHIKKIERLNAAGSAFLILKDLKKIEFEPINFSNNLLTCLKAYQQKIAKIKLAIANTNNGFNLVKILFNLINIQENLIEKLSCYCPDFDSSDLKDVKISVASNLYLAEKELMEKGIEETEILNYLSGLISVGSESVLLQAGLKATKEKELWKQQKKPTKN